MLLPKKCVGLVDLRKKCYSILLVTYRFITTEEGLFDQIRVDHGKKFYLSLFVQEQLAHLKYNEFVYWSTRYYISRSASY